MNINNESFVKLATSTLTSSVWSLPDQTRIVWITLLLMANKDGYVGASIPGIATAAKVPVFAAEAAIETFLSPDKYSRSELEEGRRLKKVERGYLVINRAVYRDRISEHDRREYMAQKQREHREKKKSQPPLTTVDQSTPVTSPPHENEKPVDVSKPKRGRKKVDAPLPVNDPTPESLTGQEKSNAVKGSTEYRVQSTQIPPQPPPSGGASGADTLKPDEPEKPKPEKPKPDKEKKPPSERTIFIELWSSTYQELFKSPYIFNGARDAKAASELIAAGFTGRELVEIAVEAWKLTDKFLNSRSVTIAGFREELNRIQAALNAPTQTSTTAKSNPRNDGLSITTAQQSADITAHLKRQKEQGAQEASGNPLAT